MKRAAILFFLSAFIGSTFIFSGSQMVDRIVAVVNEKVITLTDVRIAEAFGLYAEEIGEEEEDPRSLILQKLIDQKGKGFLQRKAEKRSSMRINR
ncbi:hypothetical protein GH140_01035, partial [bacterium]|nr:hypothetical protein [bacterium]